MTCIGRGVIEERDEGRAVFQVAADTIVGVTLLNGVLQDVSAIGIERRPTIEEVGMKTVASGVAVRKDPCGLPGGVEGELLNFKDELVEERDEVDCRVSLMSRKSLRGD